MTERTGLAAVLDEAGAGESVLEAPAEQLALLGMAIPANRKVAGRPAGKRNLRNQRVADFVLATVGDPLIELTRMAMLPVEHLAAALGCSKAEAFAEKRLCAMGALPYLHQRQAIAVDVTNRSVVHLTISDHFSGGDAGEAMTINAGLAEIVENQGVGDDGER